MLNWKNSVSYLVEKQDWAVDAAIGVFSNARAPGIYKSDYILELFKRYDEEENAFEAPPLGWAPGRPLC